MFLSIVAPFYNEENLLDAFCSRAAAVGQSICKDNDDWEIILVNDGSTDNSINIALELHQNNPKIKVLDLSRNFGHQAAITAGMAHARGKWVAVIDSDLQDPPELIKDLLAKGESDNLDVVYAVRSSRSGENRFKKLSAKLFYRLLKVLTRVDIPMDTGDFRIMKKRVVSALLQCPERHRFIRGLVSWVGFRQGGVSFDRDERGIGSSKYTLPRMVRLSIDAVTSFSHLPLRIASILGFLVSGTGFIYALYVVYLKFFTDQTVPGWASIVVIVQFMGGVQLIVLGIIGEYLGRIIDEIKKRPLYLVNKFHSDE